VSIYLQRKRFRGEPNFHLMVGLFSKGEEEKNKETAS
jgi:hypothetical protein